MESNKLHYSADELVGHRVLEIRHISVQGTTIDHLRHFFVLEKGISFEIAECNPWETELKIPTFDDVHFKTSIESKYLNKLIGRSISDVLGSVFWGYFGLLIEDELVVFYSEDCTGTSRLFIKEKSQDLSTLEIKSWVTGKPIIL